jgi:hypothetical protein
VREKNERVFPATNSDASLGVSDNGDPKYRRCYVKIGASKPGAVEPYGLAPGDLARPIAHLTLSPKQVAALRDKLNELLAKWERPADTGHYYDTSSRPDDEAGGI